MKVEAPCCMIINELFCDVGDIVSEGELLIRGEAMKNLISIYSPISGVVKLVLVSPGEVVNEGDLLAEVV